MASCKFLFHFFYVLDVDKSHFKLLKIIGIGSHSVVWLVEKRVQNIKPVAVDDKTQIAEEQAAEGENHDKMAGND